MAYLSGGLAVRLLTGSALLCAVVLSAGAQDAEPPKQAERPELEAQIDKAITRGVEWLKKQQRTDGSFGDTTGNQGYGGQAGTVYHNRPGNCALALLALLKSDVPPEDACIKDGFKFLYGYMQQRGNTRTNYCRGLTLMAIESLYEATVAAKMRKDGKQVTERAGDFKEPKYTLSGSDAGFASSLVRDLVGEQTKGGGWRYGNPFPSVGSDEDISATQIVLLALKSATRMKLSVPSSTFERALKFVFDSQEKDGPKIDRPIDGSYRAGDRSTYQSNGEDRARGWAYELKSDQKAETVPTGSMTCAGVTELLILKSVLKSAISEQLNKRVEQAIYDGFAWINHNWTVKENPKSIRSHYYYLYGIERIATLARYERIGKHMWFKEGAEYLVGAQKEPGNWDDRDVTPTDLYATCFALLFLRRGTVPIGDVMTGDRR